MSAPSAAWPLPVLLGSLARAQWGQLDGRAHAGQRAILRALVDLLPHRSGEGTITAAQVADAAGYKERHTRDCLAALEAAGLIEWRRGWLDRGRPRPGHVRVIKAAVVDLIKAARGDGRAAARSQARADALKQRLTGLRRTTIVGHRQRKPLSEGPAMTASPPPYREVTARAERPPAPVCTTCGHLRGPHGVRIALGRLHPHPWTTA